MRVVRSLFWAWAPSLLVMGCGAAGASERSGASSPSNAEEASSCGDTAACTAACESGTGAACYAAGLRYETGSGAEQSYDRAASLYSRACNAQEPRGCTNLGVMREIGLGGGERDYAAAADLYRRACDGGDAQGCANLGLRYEEGAGVPKDPARARELLQRACSRGNAHACRWLE